MVSDVGCTPQSILRRTNPSCSIVSDTHDPIQELELGINPAERDTDGDGIDDGDELAGGTDPTIHDYEPPEIDVFRANFYKPSGSLDTTYDLGYSATDPAGVASTRVVKGDEVREATDHDDYPDSVSVSTRFETGPGESLFDTVFGTTVRIHASDRHDNTHEKVGMERSNFYGTLADELGPMADEDTAADLGLLSGFTAGMGGTARTVEAVLDDPIGFVDSLSQLARMMNRLGILPKLLAAMPEQMVEDLREKQDRNNPYDPDTEADRYEAFEAGYYLGYGGYVLASMVVGDQATKSVKSSSQFQKVVDKLDRNGRVTQANRYLDAAKSRTTEPVKKGGYKLGARAAQGRWHLSKASGRRVLSGMKTAGQQYHVAQKLSEANGAILSKFDGYSPRIQRHLGRITARHGDEGVEFAAKADQDDVTQMTEMRRAMTDGGQLTVDESRLWSYRLAKLVGDDDISSAEFGRYLDNLEAMDHATRQNLVRLTLQGDTASPAEAVQFTNDLRTLRSVDGVDDVYHRAVRGDRDNFRGAAFESRYAASKSDDVIAVGKDKPDSIDANRPGDIDVLTEEGGERIGYELKSGSSKGEIGEIANGYEKMIDSNVVDDYKIVFKREPSAELKQYMQSKDIDYEVYASGV